MEKAKSYEKLKKFQEAILEEYNNTEYVPNEKKEESEE